MAHNTALKVAFIEARKKQRVVARRMGIHEVRLSRIITGHADPTDDEKKALSKILKRPIDHLFSEAVA